jgi:cell division protein FtsI (penicillin-binding protein 3)
VLRRRLLLSGLLLFALGLAGRAFQIAVAQHVHWSGRAAEQHVEQMELPAPRGTIYDRDGVPLGASREVYSLAVAGREVADRQALIRKLREHAGFTAAEAKSAVDPQRNWRVLRGRYDEDVRKALEGTPGVHIGKVMQRFYPHGSLAGELLGSVNDAGDALGGIELEFDSLLAGTPGLAVVRRAPSGRAIAGMMLRVSEPVPGRDVRLTIDYELQAIADDALRDAVAQTRASGGELLLLDPRTGEILAAVSRRSAKTARNWSAVTAPYEPGSTLKPFTVAAVLAEGRASLDDSIYGEDGRYAVAGRVLTDVHAYGWLTLADGLRHSSNVVVAKAGARLTPTQHYQYLRDFGFGSPTGVAYPSESGGLLRRPRGWSRQSPASLSIGYEISVTPLQLALGYAALANGGVLMEPRLVREVRARDGRLERTFEPRAVRRVVPAEVAAALRDVLIGAVEEGTGQAAAMGPFKVAGKTGTVRVTHNGRYVRGAYRSTFAGFFPAEDPQLVFLVKLDEPKGAYYGGATAAPVTRATLEAALAAWSTPIDRRAVATAPSELPVLPPSRERAAAVSVRPITLDAPDRGAVEPSLPVAFVRASARTPAGAARIVPDVAGAPARDAVQSLHAAGLRVRVVGTGRVRETVPRAGAAVRAGTVVRVFGSVQSR